MRWIGLFFLSPLRRWKLACRLFPYRIIPQICAAVARPPVCISPVVSVIPTRVRPICVFLTGLCFLLVFVLLHFEKPFFHFWPCCSPLPLPLPRLPLPLSLPGLPLPLPLPSLILPLSSVPDHPLVWFVLQVLGFLSTNSRHVAVKFHTMPISPSVQAVCFFMLVQRCRSLSQISSILSCQQC